MKILLTGAGGLLGTELGRILGGDPVARPTLPAPMSDHLAIPLTHADLDVTDADAVRRVLARHAPEVVVHCAAYTSVDRAESEPLQARRVNVEGAAHVARASAELGALLVYLGTDFVFDGEREEPYRPDDPTGPLGVYGRTKLEGEEVVRAAGPAHLLVRTSWVYGAGGRNFVDAVLERVRSGEDLRVVADQTGRPTWARNLAATLLELVERGARGVWHVADAGTTTRHGLAVAALRAAGEEARVRPVSTGEYGAPASRPRYSVLDTSATEAFLGRPMVPWRDALARYLAERP